MTSIHAVSQPFYLWRQWAIADQDRCSLRLRSYSDWNTSFIWSQGVTVASCPCEDDNHVAPAAECRCGIYGYATYQDLLIASFAGYTIDAVFGVIQCYGKIHIHQSGARVQYARPISLFLPPAVAHNFSVVSIKEMVSFYGTTLEIIEPSTLWKFVKNNPTVYPVVCPPVSLSTFSVQEQSINYTGLFSDFVIPLDSQY